MQQDIYIGIKRTITVNWNENAAGFNRKVILQNCAPATTCIRKVNNTLTDNVEYLDSVEPIYNLLVKVL